MNNELKELRKLCLEASYFGKDGNLQSTFSSLEILYTLYNRIFDLEKIKRKDENRDIFIMSKGQSNLGFMATLTQIGILSKEELNSFCKLHSRISMQVDFTKFDTVVENSAGSLGHGFPMAVGVAIAKKIKKAGGRVYCLAGDGEMNEGTMWEACIMAASEKLDNLCLIIDDNKSIKDIINLDSFKEKLEAFGFMVYKVNGHDETELERVFRESVNMSSKPVAVIAETQRGYGSNTLMNEKEWFHKAPNEGELKMLVEEVEKFA